MASEKLQAQLRVWYQSRYHYPNLNIAGEYAGSSPFIIDGDSLLRHVFSDARIDFSTGFQLLHAAYAAEQLLENLRRRNCVFDIVFFEQHRKICTPACNPDAVWKYAFAREVMIRHLQPLGLDGEKLVWKFDSVTDKDFQVWLSKRKPLFVDRKSVV